MASFSAQMYRATPRLRRILEFVFLIAALTVVEVREDIQIILDLHARFALPLVLCDIAFIEYSPL